METKSITVILPVKNEAGTLPEVLQQISSVLPDAEIIVVNDGSSDESASIARSCGATVISLPVSYGNGAAIKAGVRAAKGEMLVFLDADGQHAPRDIPRLLAKLAEGYDMVVGARSSTSQASLHRAAANGFYNRFASWMVGHPIADLTSGFRAVRANKFRKFLYLLPNGFSYPTTITMSFFRAGYPVAYEPIVAQTRIGKSHIRLVRDGIRFLLIIFNDWHPLFATKAVPAHQSRLFYDRPGILPAYLHGRSSFHQHERAVVHYLGAGVSDRIDLRADHRVEFSR